MLSINQTAKFAQNPGAEFEEIAEIYANYQSITVAATTHLRQWQSMEHLPFSENWKLVTGS